MQIVQRHFSRRQRERERERASEMAGKVARKKNCHCLELVGASLVFANPTYSSHFFTTIITTIDVRLVFSAHLIFFLFRLKFNAES